MTWHVSVRSRGCALLVGLLLWGGPAAAQTVLVSTVLQSDLPANGSTAGVILASATGISVGYTLFADGEGMFVTAIDGVNVSVRRAYGTPSVAHKIGALVYAGAGSSFQTSDAVPGASCAAASVVPHINLSTGSVFWCVGDLWARVVAPVAAPTSGFGAVVLAKSATLTTPTLASATLTTPTLTTPTITGATLAGTLAGTPTFSGNATFSGNPIFSGSPVITGRLLHRESFDQPFIVLEEDFTPKVLTDGGTNVVLGSPVGVIEYREEQNKTTSSWVVANGTLDISADNTTDNEGVEIYLGDDDDQTTGWVIAQSTGLCFNVNFTITLIAGTDQFVIGWRQNEAFRDDNVYTGYTDWSIVGVTAVDGSIFAQHEVNGGGTLSDDSGTDIANASTHTLSSCILTTGIPTAALDGTAITLTNGGTAHTSGTKMNPFISYLQAGGVVDPNIRINYFELVALP